jgi:hypothetical protein
VRVRPEIGVSGENEKTLVDTLPFSSPLRGEGQGEGGISEGEI